MLVHRQKLLVATIILNVLTGCTHEGHAEGAAQGQSQRSTLPRAIVPPPDAQPVVRGRYGLQSTQPTPEQQDPLQQLIELRLSPSLQSTVGDALQYVLLRSGYSLCAVTPEVAPLFSRPLPSVHYQLGPISLRQAIEVLGGRAWQLQTDPVLRTVCFAQRKPGALPIAEATP